ncbi:hypothetical protein CC86DRAFT_463409 [Ophiobolus disseminans]|uniref:Uncharacterized protein n=1 Tax=Ophiobolus disseminans TaxID=1469910 RepID=A0A6A7AFT4_9PLEO|nr:hypothetical protein CC86DRAFT_463409 [Ophiobolus disseminans]
MLCWASSRRLSITTHNKTLNSRTTIQALASTSSFSKPDPTHTPAIKMHFTLPTLVLAALTTLATSSPTHLTARDTWVGYAYTTNGGGAGDLVANGGCVNLHNQASFVRMQTGYRCRFYRSSNCGSQIGGNEGLQGNAMQIQGLSEGAWSGTCWWG